MPVVMLTIIWGPLALVASADEQKDVTQPLSDDTAEATESLPKGAVIRLGTLRYRHPGWYKYIQFLPGQHQFVVSTKDSSPRVWNASDGRLVHEFSHSGSASRFKIHRPTGQSGLLSTDINGETRICRTRFVLRGKKGGKHLTWTEPFTEHSTRFALSPDGTTLVTGTYNGSLKIRDLNTGKEKEVRPAVSGEIQSIDWSPDGEVIAAAGRRAVVLWHWNSDAQLIRLKGLTRGGQVVQYSHDGRTLAVGSSSKSAATLWDTKTNTRVRVLNFGNENYYREGLCFSPDDGTLYVPNSRAKKIEVYNVVTGDMTDSLDTGVVEPRTVSISDDGRYLATTGSSAQTAVWDMTTHARISDDHDGHADFAGELAFSEDGQTMISGSMDGTVRIWDIRKGRQIRLLQHDRRVSGMALAGATLATVSLDDTVRIWQPATGRQLHSLKGHGTFGGNGMTAVTSVDGNQQLLSFGSDFFLRRYDLESGEQLARTPIRPADVEISERPDGTIKIGNERERQPELGNAQFNSRGTRLFLSVNGSVFGYDTQTGRQDFEYIPEAPIQNLLVSPNDSVFAVVVRNPPGQTPRPGHMLRICDYKDSHVMHEVGIFDFAYHICFSNSGRYIAVACNRWKPSRSMSSVHIYDLSTQTFSAVIPTGNYQIRGMTFSADGKMIATSSDDTTIIVWEIADFRSAAEPE